MSKINNLKHHVTVLNSLSSLALQIVSTISGLIIPRLILSQLGSDVNGLVSSLAQFLNFVTLLEGGLSAVIMANLYKPIAERNHNKISSIVKTTQNFYHNVSYIFIAYSVGLAIIYPLVIHSSFSFAYISSLTLIMAISVFIQYNMALSFKVLLNAGKKVYIVSITQITIIILNTLSAALVLNFWSNIHLVKIVAALIYLIQPIIYSHFAKKYFSLNKNSSLDKSLLKERWSGFGINIAAFIHYNTDIIVLTLFTNLETVSVYAVYALVTTGLRQAIQAISGGIIPSLGNAYASKNARNLERIFNKYETTIFFFTFLLFSVGALLITPFVQLYTHGITDTNYYQPLLGILLIIAEGICCLREPYVNMAYSANRFKNITKHAIIEAALNITISVTLVFNFGVIGVALGTLISMAYRTVFHMWYLRKIINRRYGATIWKLISYSTISIIGIFLCQKLLPIQEISIINWIVYATYYTIIIACGLTSILAVKAFIQKKSIKIPGQTL